ncbi:MAG TPA: hypothetical protein VEV41_23195, partial [Terriglobales bacterium]|nr:hypothetical protein [Terriglobales bacterium]
MVVILHLWTAFSKNMTAKRSLGHQAAATGVRLWRVILHVVSTPVKREEEKKDVLEVLEEHALAREELSSRVSARREGV